MKWTNILFALVFVVLNLSNSVYAVDSHKVTNHLISADLLVSRIQGLILSEFVPKMINNILGKQKQDRSVRSADDFGYTTDELKIILSKLEELSSSNAIAFKADVDNHIDNLKQTFDKNFASITKRLSEERRERIFRKISDPEWLQLNALYFKNVSGIESYVSLLWALSPNSFSNDELTNELSMGYATALLQTYRIHEKYKYDRAVVRAYLDKKESSLNIFLNKYDLLLIGRSHLHSLILSDEDISSLLPGRVDLKWLQNNKNQIMKASGSMGKEDLMLIRRVFQKTTSDLHGTLWFKTLYKEQMDKAQSDILGLSDQITFTSREPNISGACDYYQKKFDVQSLEDNKWNWKKAKTIDGKLIDESSYNMRMLYDVYRLGCFTGRNTKAALKVLEQWASSHGDTGKKAQISHCELARLYRYGIGTEVDEDKATQWEQKFFDVSQGHKCLKRRVIDPDNPLRMITDL